MTLFCVLLTHVIFNCSKYGRVSQQHLVSQGIILIACVIETAVVICFPLVSDVYRPAIASSQSGNFYPEVHFTCSLHTRNRKGPGKFLNNLIMYNHIHNAAGLARLLLSEQRGCCQSFVFSAKSPFLIHVMLLITSFRTAQSTLPGPQWQLSESLGAGLKRHLHQEEKKRTRPNICLYVYLPQQIKVACFEFTSNKKPL